MQIIRSSRECKWVTDCAYCGCVFIYKGDEVEVSVSEDTGRNVAEVMCPECKRRITIPTMAKYRREINQTSDDWDEDYAYEQC